MTNIP